MWKALGCAVQGKGHVAKGICCQDKIAGLEKNGVHAIALADGAGSAPLSHFGAEKAASYICERLCSDFDFMYSDGSGGARAREKLMAGLLAVIRGLAVEKNCVMKDLASTLLAVAVKGDAVLAVHLGDGVIGCLKSDGLRTISRPENGGYANVTTFTTSKTAAASVKLIKGQVKDKKAFILMSDGSCASLYDKRTGNISSGLGSFMEQSDRCNSLALEAQLIESFRNDVRDRTNDDCSIAILYMDGESFPGYTGLGFQEKLGLLNTGSYGRSYKDADKILSFIAESGATLKSITSWYHKKPARINRALSRLERMNLVYADEGVYRPVLKMTRTDGGMLRLEDYGE